MTRFPLSIESVFLTEAKFILENFPHLWWYPFWYFGLPFWLVYQPIPIFLTAFFSFVAEIPIAYSYRILTGFFLVLGSIGVYFWAKYLTKNKFASLVAAVLFAFLPSVAYLFLTPDWYQFGLIPLRLVNTFVYGEGPHIWGLALVPFACLFFQKLMNQPKKRGNWILAVVFTSLILLTSLTAFVGLLVFLFFIFWLEASQRDFGRKFFAALLLGFFVFGLCFFWYNPQFLQAAFAYSLGEGGGMLSGVWANIVFSLAVLPTLLGLLYGVYNFLGRSFGKRALSLVLPASFFLFLFILIYSWFTWDVALFPLPFKTIPRLIPELELALALLLAAVIAAFPKKLSYFFAVVAIVISLLWGWEQREKFCYLVRPHENFSTTSEFVIAKKLEDLEAKRVYVTGTHAFWLNFFTDTFQLRGGKGGDFGGLNPWWGHLSYFINKGEAPNPSGARLTEKWLRSLGIEYIVVNYPGSPVYYHDFVNLERFEKFKEVFNYQRDKILKVPTKNTSMALVLPQGWSEEIGKPANVESGKIVLDEERLEKYFSFVEGKGKSLVIEYPDGNWSQMKIPEGQIEADKEILIRQTYYRGWRAKSEGKRLRLSPDPIGFTRIENPGEGEIVFQFRPDIGIWLSGLTSLIVLVVFGVFLKSSWFMKSK